MGVLDIFSKRQKKLRGEVPDVYTYGEIPSPLRVQIIHILAEALGGPEEYYSDNWTIRDNVRHAYKIIVEALCREYGLFVLTPDTRRDLGRHSYFEELCSFILNEAEVERVLDAVELSFRVIDKRVRESEYRHNTNADDVATEAIAELNERFKQHGCGFQYNSHEILRVDSEFLHSEVVKNALRLMGDKKYAGAEEEFLKAHEHYRHGREKEALGECLKSFESTMKAICEKRKWKYDKAKDTSKALIDVCFKNLLIPEFWTQHFSSLRSMLESSVPTVRNKLGGHGQGVEIVKVPPHLTSYVLHMTAATIVFLIQAEREL